MIYETPAEQEWATSFTDRDERLALEIAEFVADRAQLFSDYECRAWALTDFGVWAVLAGQSPTLSVAPGQQSDQEAFWP